jgi:hypothetical protein
MPAAAKKKARTPASATPKKASQVKKASPAKKPAKKKADHHGDPISRTHIADLRTKLNYFLQPDFTEGDFWPRLDKRLYGQLPNLIAQTLDALNAHYPAKKKLSATARHPHASVA